MPKPRPLSPSLRLLRAGLALVALCLLTTACEQGPALEDVRQLHRQGRHQQALEPLRAMLEESPDDPELNYLYGTALNRTQSARMSVWSLRKAAADPEWERRARTELASAYLQSGHFEDAIEAATSVLEDEPEDIDMLSLRGMAYLNEGKRAELALEDFETVLDLTPDDVAAMASRASALLVLGDVEGAEEAIAEIQQLGGDDESGAGIGAMICTTGAVLASEKGAEDAAERFEACLEAHPGDHQLIEQSIAFYDEQGNRERATEILEKAHEIWPGSQAYRQALASRAIEDGDEARAEEILRSGTTKPDPRTRSTAWTDLTNFYVQRDRLDDAIAAYQEALALTPNPSQLSLLQHADLLARAERHAEALEVAKSLEQDAYRGLIEARVHLNEGRPAEALARLEQTFTTWPNNPGARYYAARAAEQIGDFERAVEEYRQSIRSDPEQTEAALRLAKLYLEAGALQNAWNSAAQYFRGHPDDPEGVRVLLRAATVADPKSVQQLYARLRGTPLWPTALAIRAQRVEEAQGAEAALEILEGSPGPNPNRPRNAELLRTHVRLLLAVGRVEDARKRVDAALATAPKAAAFHEIHGLVLEREGAEADAIRAAYERAVELDPDSWQAQESLARRTEADGRLEEALALYERAAELAPERTSPRQHAAEALLRAGRVPAAEEIWEEQLRDHPWDARSALALARLRADRGAFDDRTLELAERAVLFRGGEEAQDLLLEVHRRRGEEERAQQLAQAIETGSSLPPSRITPVDGL